MTDASRYQLVRLKNGTWSIRSAVEGETFHPVIGPAAEAESLYVRQLRLADRMRATPEEFVIWDVGLGGGANALTVLNHTRGAGGSLRVMSFDQTLEPLEFAMSNAGRLGYFAGFEPVVERLLREGSVSFADGNRKVCWQVHGGDFPTRLADGSFAGLAAPHAILFDAYSPARNPAMWTLPLFKELKRHLLLERPCALPTYSRSTLLRVTLLLAGFYVGVGHATGEKEETTIASNRMEMITEPLGREWLKRARASTSAEPLHEPVYRQQPLSRDSLSQLLEHPQFRLLPASGSQDWKDAGATSATAGPAGW